MLRFCNKQAEQSDFTVAGTVPVSHRIPFYTTRWNNGVYHLSGDKYRYYLWKNQLGMNK